MEIQPIRYREYVSKRVRKEDPKTISWIKREMEIEFDGANARGPQRNNNPKRMWWIE